MKRPCIRGTWRVVLKSMWKDPETGESPPAIEAYLAVRQTYSVISIRMLTAESTSEIQGVDLIRAADGTYRIAGVYRNEPKIALRERSPIHYGALLLNVEGDPPTRLSGHYWTDRGSQGEIETTTFSPVVCANFQAATQKLGSASAASAGSTNTPGDAGGESAGPTGVGT